MSGVTIRLPDALLAELRSEAKATRRTFAAVVRERLENRPRGRRPSFYERNKDLAGCLAGPGGAATNDAPKFQRR